MPNPLLPVHGLVRMLALWPGFCLKPGLQSGDVVGASHLNISTQPNSITDDVTRAKKRLLLDPLGRVCIYVSHMTTDNSNTGGHPPIGDESDHGIAPTADSRCRPQWTLTFLIQPLR
jgi:hypothetical protein